jgi:aryl-alcohol dehydrogenase-like predicted oxidoreductase
VLFRTLGRTGVQVSNLALGTMAFGALGNRDHGDCVAIVHRALDAGVNLIDTADVYSGGEAEIITGKALAELPASRRHDVLVSTKCFWPMGADPNRRGSSRRWIHDACNESLRRLGREHVDIYYLHKPDLGTDLSESLGALDELVRAGKVRYVGISTFPADRIVESHWVGDERRLVRPHLEQPPYSIVTRGIERDVLPVCQRLGMGVLVWGPLNSGWLTGKYRAGESAPIGSRAVRWAARSGLGWDETRLAVQRKHSVVTELEAVASDAGVSLTHLALAFAGSHPAVSSVLIGPRLHEQLDDQLAAADLTLSAEVLDRIDELVPPGTDVDNAADGGWQPPWLADASQRRRRDGDPTRARSR